MNYLPRWKCADSARFDAGAIAQIVKVLAIPEVQKLLQHEGGVVSPSTPEEFATFLRADVDRWTKMVKQTGIALD